VFRMTNPLSEILATRRSWVLRGVIDGCSEEARTRGFPSPPFGGFGFVIICCGLNLSRAHTHHNLTLPLLLAAVCRIPLGCNVRLRPEADTKNPATRAGHVRHVQSKSVGDIRTRHPDVNLGIQSWWRFVVSAQGPKLILMGASLIDASTKT
jgi:hypothetical protein